MVPCPEILLKFLLNLILYWTANIVRNIGNLQRNKYRLLPSIFSKNASLDQTHHLSTYCFKISFTRKCAASVTYAKVFNFDTQINWAKRSRYHIFSTRIPWEVGTAPALAGLGSSTAPPSSNSRHCCRSQQTEFPSPHRCFEALKPLDWNVIRRRRHLRYCLLSITIYLD